MRGASCQDDQPMLLGFALLSPTYGVAPPNVQSIRLSPVEYSRET